MARVSRVLTVELVERERLAAVLAGEGAGHFDLGGTEAVFPIAEGWRTVSHSFDLREDGSAILTMIYEKHD